MTTNEHKLKKILGPECDSAEGGGPSLSYNDGEFIIYTWLSGWGTEILAEGKTVRECLDIFFDPTNVRTTEYRKQLKLDGKL